MLRRWTMALALALLPGAPLAQSGSGATAPPPPAGAEEKRPIVPADPAIVAADPARAGSPAMTPTDPATAPPPLRLQLDNGFTSLHTVLPPPAQAPATPPAQTQR